MRDNSQSQLLSPKQAIAQAFHEAEAEAVAGVYSIADRINVRIVTICFALLMLISPALSMAAADDLDCVGKGAKGLINIIDMIVGMILGVGGALAIFIIVIGGCRIIFAGDNGNHVRKGMDMVKNACIGIIILASGTLIQAIVISFVTGATKKQYSNYCG